MPLRLLDAPQPMSRTALAREAPLKPWAMSPAQHALYRELHRYTSGEILGRSVLVAGHRGGGKTTLVLHALQQVRMELAATGDRPLLVRIAGPSLLLESADAQPGVADDVGRVLERVTMVLVHAVIDEVHEAFLRHGRGRGRDVGEQAELAARLRVALEGMPDLAGLRDIWSRAGLLDCGLFGAPGSRGAGAQEVRVLWSLAQAALITRGKVSRTLGEEASARRTAEGSWEVLTKGRELLNPLLGLMSGSLVGWGLIDAGQAGGFMGAAIGTLTGLATATALNFSARRLVDSTQSQNFRVELDTSVYSLSLLLPRLVQQLRAIGLSPVFLIDELDKVRDLRERMRELVRHLKSLVSEDAFFCFVTDRDYFELVSWKIAASPYPEEHTYFTDRLHVAYLPRDLHAFLADSLSDEGPTEPDEAADRALLPYVLLGRARMHLLDLRREMKALRTASGHLHLPPGCLSRSLPARIEAAAQVTLEHVLARPDLAERAYRDGYFAQRLVDALTLPLETWQSGGHELTLDRASLRARLFARMDTSAFPEEAGGGPRVWLPEPDEALLFDATQELVAALSAPGGAPALLEDGQRLAAHLPPDARAVLRAHLPAGPMLLDAGGGRLRFVVDHLGRPITAP